MKEVLDGPAIVYCEGAFNTLNGKTAHGLVRFTERYEVLSVVDSTQSGIDAGVILDGKPKGIIILSSVEEAIQDALSRGIKPGFLVVGLAPDGGRLPAYAREHLQAAIRRGLSIDSGLHDFLSEDPVFAALAEQYGVRLRDIRKPKPRHLLNFFSGKIEQVNSLKVAILGTDSAIGKRTTAWILVHALRDLHIKTEMVGTGQTSWLQGAKYSLVLDSLVNDFVAGEIEHAVFSAWQEGAEAIVVEGQGSLMNPAFPGGFEILAAARPDVVVLQHAPARKEYDGFPGYKLHDLEHQIRAIELLSGKPVVAVTINHEGLDEASIPEIREKITLETGLPAFDVLLEGGDRLARLIEQYRKNRT